jgi:hypothetical protein
MNYNAYRFRVAKPSTKLTSLLGPAALGGAVSVTAFLADTSDGSVDQRFAKLLRGVTPWLREPAK